MIESRSRCSHTFRAFNVTAVMPAPSVSFNVQKGDGSSVALVALEGEASSVAAKRIVAENGFAEADTAPILQEIERLRSIPTGGIQVV